MEAYERKILSLVVAVFMFGLTAGYIQTYLIHGDARAVLYWAVCAIMFIIYLWLELPRKEVDVDPILDYVDKVEEETTLELCFCSREGWYGEVLHKWPSNLLDFLAKTENISEDTWVSLFRVINGETLKTNTPVTQVISDNKHNWFFSVPEGDYDIYFEKDGAFAEHFLITVG